MGMYGAHKMFGQAGWYMPTKHVRVLVSWSGMVLIGQEGEMEMVE